MARTDTPEVETKPLLAGRGREQQGVFDLSPRFGESGAAPHGASVLALWKDLEWHVGRMNLSQAN